MQAANFCMQAASLAARHHNALTETLRRAGKGGGIRLRERYIRELAGRNGHVRLPSTLGGHRGDACLLVHRELRK